MSIKLFFSAKRFLLILMAVFVVTTALQSQIQANNAKTITVSDFEDEKKLPNIIFVGGFREVSKDVCITDISEDAFAGNFSQRLGFDFTKLGASDPLPDPSNSYYRAFIKPPVTDLSPYSYSFAVKSTSFKNIKFTVVDANSEYFSIRIKITNPGAWQKVVLPSDWPFCDATLISNLDSRSISGGDKNQKIDLPVKFMGFDIAEKDLIDSSYHNKGTHTLFIDDVILTEGAAPAASPAPAPVATSAPTQTPTPAPTPSPIVETPKELIVPKTFSDTVLHWAEENINYMASRGIVKGVSDTLFEPERNITRAEFASIVIRILGQQQTPYKGQYKDIASTSWYANTLQAAFDIGIIDDNMVIDNSFLPEVPITREEMTAIIIRAYEWKVGISAQTGDLSKFTDKDNVNSWAVRYISSANALGIVNGISETQLAPKNNATRAEAATITMRLMKQI